MCAKYFVTSNQEYIYTPSDLVIMENHYFVERENKVWNVFQTGARVHFKVTKNVLALL